MTLPETLVVLVLMGLSFSFGAHYLNRGLPALRVAGERVEGALNQTRAKSMVTTRAHRLRPQAGGAVVVESAPSCFDATWTEEPALGISLPDAVHMENSDWVLCFNSRGIASEHLTITLVDDRGQSQQLEILRGGILRWVE